MNDWTTHFRVDHRASLVECKLAKGGEPYGDPVMKRTAEPGWWLCRNPENGYVWVVMEKETFDSLYCEMGKSPVKKEKKQEDGHRKGQSRHQSASTEGNSIDQWSDDSLFGCLKECGDGEGEAEESADEVV